MMMPYFKDEFGNPHSSHHIYGRTASTAIEAARKKIANCLNTNYQDIYFTSGATESNNIALRQILKNPNKNHIITKIYRKKLLLYLKKVESK